MKQVKVAVSILAADFGALNSEIASVESYADLVSVDVMDGHFVPNITVGPAVVAALKTTLPIECHLMISNPEDYIESFAKAGADIISVHFEALGERSGKVLQRIRELNCASSLAIKPATLTSEIYEYLDDMDAVVIMSVEPGFGGQVFLHSALAKIQDLRARKPDLDIIVDGGINAETAALVREAGANILVSGSYVFGALDRAKAIASLR